jgi:hypothetical protein
MHRVTGSDVERAKKDLRLRTLAPIGYDFGRLVYLSSLRDFSTGEYHHYGLAHSFSESVATTALASCHKEVFCDLTLSPLEAFVDQVERFVRSSAHNFEKTVSAWETLEAYRVTIPSNCDQLTAGLFRSNVKVAIVVLKSRQSNHQEKSRSASRFPLLGR